MGLFDYVHCDVELPDGFKGEFQTKDFDCPYMEHYRITADGRLMLRVIDFEEERPESEWLYSADDPDVLNRMEHVHSKTKVHWKEEDQNYHGMLNFYGKGAGDEWHEYNAKFTDGRLVEIIQIPDSDSDGQVNFSNEPVSDAVQLNQPSLNKSE